MKIKKNNPDNKNFVEFVEFSDIPVGGYFMTPTQDWLYLKFDDYHAIVVDHKRICASGTINGYDVGKTLSLYAREAFERCYEGLIPCHVDFEVVQHILIS